MGDGELGQHPWQVHARARRFQVRPESVDWRREMPGEKGAEVVPSSESLAGAPVSQFPPASSGHQHLCCVQEGTRSPNT